jgi:hypothetical protein
MGRWLHSHSEPCVCDAVNLVRPDDSRKSISSNPLRERTFYTHDDVRGEAYVSAEWVGWNVGWQRDAFLNRPRSELSPPDATLSP